MSLTNPAPVNVTWVLRLARAIVSVLLGLAIKSPPCVVHVCDGKDRCDHVASPVVGVVPAPSPLMSEFDVPSPQFAVTRFNRKLPLENTSGNLSIKSFT